MEFTVGRDHRRASVFGLEEAVLRLAHRNQKSTFVEDPHDPSRFALSPTSLCLEFGDGGCCGRETAGGMSNDNDVLAFVADELSQYFSDDLTVFRGLRIAIWRWISVVVWSRDVADVQFAEVRCRKLRAVSFDPLRFQCGEQRLERLGRVV